MLLVFLVDTSASMNQKTCLGTSYLDVAKGAVETFLKIRARDANVCRGDRYMLVTYDALTKSVKAGWRENLQVFLRELKNLKGHGLSNLSIALKTTFDLLNMYRLQSGIDNYGMFEIKEGFTAYLTVRGRLFPVLSESTFSNRFNMGYNPFYLEPALVLLLSDGCAQLDINGIIEQVSLPYHNLLPGAELTKELYRWDQRLFTLNLQIPGFASPNQEKSTSAATEDNSLSSLCDQTGGKLYNIISHKSLMQSMESIAQKIMVSGVIIDFEKTGPDPDPVSEAKEESNTPKRDDTFSPLNEKNTNTNDMLKGSLNGMPSLSMNGDLRNENLANGYIDKEPVITGNCGNQKGLLPTPPLPPNVQHLLQNQMHGMPIPPVRALLPTPGSPQISSGIHVRPPLPPGYPVAPMQQENRPVPLKPRNGMIDENTLEGIKMKTEGLITSSANVPGNPIRGDMSAPPPLTRSTVVSPSISVSTVWQNQRRMIFVRSNIKGNTGHWPIPESFWPDPSLAKLPPRDCHPVVKYQCKACEAMVIDNMPFDKYELEPSPLTQYILERKQPYVAWQTFISGSSPDLDLGYPFGYLKAATNLQCVNLFVLPYNYPVIMLLLDELFKIHKCKPSLKWKQSFEDYLRKLPSYYIGPLRNALRRMGAPINLIPEHMDGSLSYSVVAYLKKIKQQAKNEAERLINLHSQPYVPPIFHATLPTAPQLSDGKQKDFKELLIQKKIDASFNSSPGNSSNKTSSEDKRELFANRHLPVRVEKFQVRSYKNPFDINRGDLLEQIKRMRNNIFHSADKNIKAHDEDSLHRISIAQMGKFEELVNQVKPLRDLDQSQTRLHTFGNPFKLKQDQNVILAVDEADVNDNIAMSNQKSRKRGGDVAQPQKGKRKRNEVPPPSRRPWGPPNTPPPLNRNMINLSNASSKIDATSNKQVKIEDFDLDQKNGENRIDDDKSDISLKDNKRSYSSVNKQLRKLQLIHRTKKDNDRLSTSYVNDKRLDHENNEISGSSPILSILRTSLEDIDDKDNEELSKINISESIENDVMKKDFLKAKNRGNVDNHKSDKLTLPAFSATFVLSFDDLDDIVKRKARLELQARAAVKLRLAVWKAIRSKIDFPIIVNLIDQLQVTVEAKYLFIDNAIQEANRFQCNELSEKLKTLLPQLRQYTNNYTKFR